MKPRSAGYLHVGGFTMSNVVHIAGQVVGSGIVFVILFVVVEYIPILKLFPRFKYLVPFAIGAAAAIAGVLGSGPHSGSSPIAAAISIALAFWYTVGGIGRGLETLEKFEAAKNELPDKSNSATGQ